MNACVLLETVFDCNKARQCMVPHLQSAMSAKWVQSFRYRNDFSVSILLLHEAEIEAGLSHLEGVCVKVTRVQSH